MFRDENHIPETIAAFERLPGDVVENVAEDTYEQLDSAWDRGQDATGAPWEPLSPETIRRKGHDDILIESGETKKAVDVAVDHGKAEARIGPTTERATAILELHEYGVPENGLPARPVLEPAGRYAESQLDSVAQRLLRSRLRSVL